MDFTKRVLILDFELSERVGNRNEEEEIELGDGTRGMMEKRSIRHICKCETYLIFLFLILLGVK